MIKRAPRSQVTAIDAIPPRRRSVLKAGSAIALVLVVVGVMAPAAWAHEATAKITCTSVVFHYIDFPNEPGNSVHEGVIVDGITAASEKVSFNGPTAKSTIDYLVVGSATVTARARWHTNGANGSFSATEDLSCGGTG
jgi:hypothetical protein